MMRKTLSKKEIKELNREVLGNLGTEEFFSKKDNVVLSDDVYFLDNQPVFFSSDSGILPVLHVVLSGKVTLPCVVVDMGAVRFVVSGADIMRPGIVEIDEGIAEGGIVQIVDEKNKKALAVGQAMLPAEEMRNAKTGKVVRNLHYAGDEIFSRRI
jgi:PUA domain protein